MCGILGIFSVLPRIQWPQGHDIFSRFQQNLQLLVARGPDAQGICQLDHGIMGHCRLSVIDTEGGIQPWIDPQTHCVLIYNGEIFNFQELRTKLQQKGHQFRTRSDTEVLMKAYLEWGWDVPNYLEGFFAWALWDPRSQEVGIVRDRLGLKPLYWASTPEWFVFGSTLASLYRLPGVPQLNRPDEINLPVLSHYLAMRIPYLGQETFIPSIYLLESGGIRRWKLREGTMQTKRYWSLPLPSHLRRQHEPYLLTFDTAKEYLYSLLNQLVKERLISDVPIGAFLSGGLDSSLLVHTMQRHLHAPIPLFCAGTGNAKTDEFHFARLIADQLSFPLHEIKINPEQFWDDWLYLINQKGLPLSTPNEMSIYELAKALRQQCVVTLTGEGADEVFGGYPQMHWGVLDWIRLNNLQGKFSPLHTYYQLTYGRDEFIDDLDHYFTTVSWIDFSLKKQLIQPDIWSKLEDDMEMIQHYLDLYKQIETEDSIDRRFCWGIWLNLENLLLRVDSSTMAASVEARVPFSDHRMVEFAMSLPVEWKLTWREDTPSEAQNLFPIARCEELGYIVSKRILRAVSHGRIPHEIIQRPKYSFPVPFEDWFQGQLKTSIRDLILSNELIKNLFQYPTVENLVHRNDVRLWLLANLAHWWNWLKNFT